jgi:hypothetical protein
MRPEQRRRARTSSETSSSPQQMDTRGIEQTGFSECRQAELDAVLQGQIRSSRQLARSTGQLPRTRHLTTACSWQGAAMGLCRAGTTCRLRTY